VNYSIKTFRGYGTTSSVQVWGQLTTAEAQPSRHQSARTDKRARVWRRIRDAFRLAVSRRFPGQRLRVTCASITVDTTTDVYGHFAVSLPVSIGNAALKQVPYRVELAQPKEANPVVGEDTVLLPGDAARRVIISDIDDTIVYTGVANKLRMLWQLFARSAQERTPFPGMAALYRGLRTGRSETESNPLIYLSRSPWSIYPVLEEFFSLHRFPPDPVILLREWGITWRHPMPQRAPSHKADLLKTLFTTYTDQRFVLIGDSGQRDPELYGSFARNHPGRVEAIYIREAGESRSRRDTLEDMRTSLEELGVPMIIAQHTEQLAQDAATRGFISRSSLEATQRDSRAEAV